MFPFGQFNTSIKSEEIPAFVFMPDDRLSFLLNIKDDWVIFSMKLHI